MMEPEELMRLAIEQAALAEAAGDVPIGAVIARGRRVIAAAGNRRIVAADPTAHAEMLAIRAAARALGDWRLAGCTMAVTRHPRAEAQHPLVDCLLYSSRRQYISD